MTTPKGAASPGATQRPSANPAPKVASKPAPKPTAPPPVGSPGATQRPSANPAPKVASKPAPKPTAPPPVGSAVKDSKPLQKPKPFQENVKRFFSPPGAVLRILRMILLVAAAVFFGLTAHPHESYRIIIILEIFIILFFIIVYMLTLHDLMVSLDWPLVDLLNCIISAVFLLIVGIVALREQQRMTSFYIGGILCIILAIMSLLDAVLVTMNMLKQKEIIGGKKKKEIPSVSSVSSASRWSALGIRSASEVSTQATSRATSRASSRATSGASSKATSRASSQATSRASSQPASRASSQLPSRSSSQSPSRTSSLPKK